MAKRTHSMNELAALLDVQRQTVDRWIKQGCPFVERADRDRGKEWQLSLPDVVAWREKQAIDRAIGDTSHLGIEEARRRKTAAEAALAELELAKQRGDVVSIHVVTQVFEDQIAACRARLLSLAPKCGPLVAPVTDVRECTDLLDSVMQEALHELAGFDGTTGGIGPSDRAPDRDVDDGEAGTVPPAAESDDKPVGRPRKKTQRGSQR